MEQTKDAERPGEREEEVKDRAGIENECVPLGEERKAAVVERVPERNLAVPEALPMIKR